jgi:peptide/nickel transport system permease protein
MTRNIRAPRRPSASPLTGVLPAAVIVAVVMAAVLAPWIVSDPLAQDLSRTFAPPLSAGHVLGTDSLGRDVLSRIVWGARVSLLVSFLGAVAAIAIGATAGLAAALGPRWVRYVLDRLTDAQLAFPYVLLAIVIATALRPSTPTLVLLMILSGWAPVTRVVRSVVLGEIGRDYVKAARVVGASTFRIARKYLAPTVVPALLSLFPLQMAAMILIESTLSYLGLGVQPPTSSWGSIMLGGQQYLSFAWWITTFPGVAIILTSGALLALGRAVEQRIASRRLRRTMRLSNAIGPAVRPTDAVDGKHPELVKIGAYSPLPADPDPDAVLSVRSLSVRFPQPDGVPLQLVDQLSLTVRAGSCVGIVGESGSGKSMSCLALMGLTPEPGVVSGEVRLLGRELVGEEERALRSIRGKDMAMVFQDPSAALNPLRTIGRQISDVLAAHQFGSRRAIRERTLETLTDVGFPRPADRLGAYPFQLSGGLRQRVAIAMALACRPKLVIADEPTTNLDVSIQDQVLELFADLMRREHFGLILVSHDLGVISKIADSAVVMYGGQVVESGPTSDVLFRAQHPYTRGLLAAMPTMGMARDRRLVPIPGSVDRSLARVPACAFSSRCPAGSECAPTAPEWHSVEGTDHLVHCRTPDQRELSLS